MQCKVQDDRPPLAFVLHRLVSLVFVHDRRHHLVHHLHELPVMRCRQTRDAAAAAAEAIAATPEEPVAVRNVAVEVGASGPLAQAARVNDDSLGGLVGSVPGRYMRLYDGGSQWWSSLPETGC
jgi:hypothetical protein